MPCQAHATPAVALAGRVSGVDSLACVSCAELPAYGHGGRSSGSNTRVAPARYPSRQVGGLSHLHRFPLILQRVCQEISHVPQLCSLDVALGQTYGCRLPDDQTNMVVDLSPLRMHSGNWRAVNSVDDHTYYLNVCGELNPNPAGSTSTATRFVAAS